MRYRVALTVALSLASAMLVSAPAAAKRPAPPSVQPLVSNGVVYSAVHDRRVVNNHYSAFVAYVEARRPDTGVLIWRAKVYEIAYAPRLETDVQDVWITALTANAKELLVTTEGGHHYVIDLETRQVRQSK
jgi:hypothetical protein